MNFSLILLALFLTCPVFGQEIIITPQNYNGITGQIRTNVFERSETAYFSDPAMQTLMTPVISNEIRRSIGLPVQPPLTPRRASGLTSIGGTVQGPITFNVGSSLIGSGSTLSVTNCPYNLIIPDWTNINNITAGWTSGEGCFNPSLPLDPNQRLAQDEATCTCLKRDNSLVGFMSTGPSAVRQEMSVEGVKNNVEFMNRSLSNFRSGLLLQTSLLCYTPEEARSVPRLFNNKLTEIDDALGAYVNGAKDAITNSARNNGLGQEATASLRTSAASLVVPEPNMALLTAGFNADDNSCVSVKEFLAYKQAPSEPEFYQALKEEEFEPANWDISLLKSRINILLQNHKLGTPEFKLLRSRIRFLERNGLWRAVFSAPATLNQSLEKKEELFNILKETMGRDKCEGTGCQLNFLNKLSDYRQRSRDFLSAEPAEVVTNLINNSELERAKGMFNAANAPKILQTPALPSSPEAYRNYMQMFNSHLAQCRPGAEQSATNSCMISYAAYCRETADIRANLNSTTAPYSPEDFEYESAYNNELDPNQNPAYQQFRSQVCGERRSSSGVATFATFKQQHCRGRNLQKPECKADDEGRRALVGKFITEYPSPGNGPLLDNAAAKDSNAGLTAFLGVMPDDGNLEVEDARETANASSSIRDVGTRARTTFASSTGGRTFSRGRVAAVSPQNRAIASQTTSEPVARNQTQTQSPAAQASGSVFLPSGSEQSAAVFAPTSTPQARAVNASAQLRQNETESQEIRSEITSLRANLENESSRPPAARDSSAIRDLNSRLASLERELEEKTREGDALRRSAASDRDNDEDDQDDDSDSARNRTSRRVSGDSRGNSSAGSQTVNANTAGANSGSVALPSQLGGGNASLGSSGNGSRATSGKSPARAKEASQGAITVSAASSSEYQNLRAQASGDAVSGSLPTDMYDRLVSSGDTSILEERYRDQLPTTPGEVRRFEIKKEGTGEKVEILISRTESGFTLAFGQGQNRSIASEKSSPEPVRSARREDLVREVAPGSN